MKRKGIYVTGLLCAFCQRPVTARLKPFLGLLSGSFLPSVSLLHFKK
jgi:hypothetical protein